MESILHSISEVTGPVAWPLFALFASVFFRREACDLLGRLRKGAGAEFDPPPQAPIRPAEVAGGSTVPALSSSPHALTKVPSTPATLNWEAVISDLPLVKGTDAGPGREALLMRLLARAVLISRFEQVEGNIWKSQVDMLMHLDAIATGDAPGRLKEQFYDKAAARFPDVFAAYSFEGYLGFLRNFTLVVIQANSIEISQEGREYLAWRLEQSRPPKVAG